MNKNKIYIISDSTGETAHHISKAVLSQYEGADIEECIFPMIRTKAQLDKVLNIIKQDPELIMYTIVNTELSDYLKDFCIANNILWLAPLEKIHSDIKFYLNLKNSRIPGKQHELDESYFNRIKAIDYTLAHDDGQISDAIVEADIILVGVSRTSKSPTCVYLANKGLKSANIPYIAGLPFPDLSHCKNSLIVGLSINPERLVDIRKTRLTNLQENSITDYIDIDAVKEEIKESRAMFHKNHWTIIDVTKRSVEETAAEILQLYKNRE